MNKSPVIAHIKARSMVLKVPSSGTNNIIKKVLLTGDDGGHGGITPKTIRDIMPC